MIKRFLSNLKGAILILVNPRYLKDRVDSINSEMIDLPTGLAIVAKSEHKQLDTILEKYPTDLVLKERIEELKQEIPVEKDKLKELIFARKELEALREKRCDSCYNTYLLECSHSLDKEE